MSEIWALSLGTSLQDMDGLNLGATTLLQGKREPSNYHTHAKTQHAVFTKPHSFLFLEELDFSGARLRDIELTHVHHLPRLSVVILTDTGVSDEA